MQIKIFTATSTFGSATKRTDADASKASAAALEEEVNRWLVDMRHDDLMIHSMQSMEEVVPFSSVSTTGLYSRTMTIAYSPKSSK